MFLRTIVLIFSLCFTTNFAICPTKIACESFKRWGWFDGIVCVISNSTIDSDNFSISSKRNESVALDFFQNKNVSYLPTRLQITFPELQQIHAKSCSIKAIFKDNFKNLTMLTFLDLSFNQIEKIESDSFNDLTSLEQLFLSKKFWLIIC